MIAFPRTNIGLAERAQENVGVNRSSPFYSRPFVLPFSLSTVRLTRSPSIPPANLIESSEHPYIHRRRVFLPSSLFSIPHSRAALPEFLSRELQVRENDSRKNRRVSSTSNLDDIFFLASVCKWVMVQSHPLIPYSGAKKKEARKQRSVPGRRTNSKDR